MESTAIIDSRMGRYKSLHLVATSAADELILEAIGKLLGEGQSGDRLIVDVQASDRRVHWVVEAKSEDAYFGEMDY